MNTADYLLENARDDDVAIIADEKIYTYQDLRCATADLIGLLGQRGIAPGSRVGLFAANSFFWAAAYLAILKSGAVVVPFTTVATPADIGAMREFSGCQVTFLQRRFLAKFNEAFGRPDDLIFDDCLEDGLSGQANPGKIQPQASGDPAFADSQDAALMFTSGTSYKPKAVRISHRNIQANTNSIIEYLGLTSAERVMVVLPFYYCFGTSLLHTHLRAGASLVLSNNFVFPETVLDQIETLACTGFGGVPSTYQTLIRNTSLSRRKMESLRKLQQAGGKLPAPQIRELVDMLPQAKVYVMYGQTEATARLSCLSPDLLETKLGSVGKGIPGVTLRVVNETNQDVSPGEVGEIYATGDNIAMGYLDDPEATAEKFDGGVLHTGDLATVDDDGFIFIVDRKADFIKTFGYRVSSQQIEDCILALGDIVAAAAIAAPDVERGEAIRVFVTLKSGSPLTPEDILRHCQENLARHMIPKTVEILASLPLSSQGKVLKSELRRRINQSTSNEIC